MPASPDPDVIQTKVCNAFFKDEQLTKLKYASGSISLELVRYIMGGLWLGGNISLTATKLIFELNRLNKLFHSGDYRVEIPLVDISQVIVVKPALGFKTIQFIIPNGDFKIRVKAAQEFADLIQETRAKVVQHN